MEYLVRWRGLGYDEASWEWDVDLGSVRTPGARAQAEPVGAAPLGFEEALAKFELLQRAGPRALRNASSNTRAQAKKPVEWKETPSFLKGGECWASPPPFR